MADFVRFWNLLNSHFGLEEVLVRIALLAGEAHGHMSTAECCLGTGGMGDCCKNISPILQRNTTTTHEIIVFVDMIWDETPNSSPTDHYFQEVVVSGGRVQQVLSTSSPSLPNARYSNLILRTVDAGFYLGRDLSSLPSLSLTETSSRKEQELFHPVGVATLDSSFVESLRDGTRRTQMRSTHLNRLDSMGQNALVPQLVDAPLPARRPGRTAGVGTSTTTNRAGSSRVGAAQDHSTTSGDHASRPPPEEPILPSFFYARESLRQHVSNSGRLSLTGDPVKSQQVPAVGGAADALLAQSLDIVSQILASVGVKWYVSGGLLIQMLRFGGRGVAHKLRQLAFGVAEDFTEDEMNMLKSMLEQDVVEYLAIRRLRELGLFLRRVQSVVVDARRISSDHDHHAAGDQVVEKSKRYVVVRRRVAAEQGGGNKNEGRTSVGGGDDQLENNLHELGAVFLNHEDRVDPLFANDAFEDTVRLTGAEVKLQRTSPHHEADAPVEEAEPSVEESFVLDVEAFAELPIFARMTSDTDIFRPPDDEKAPPDATPQQIRGGEFPATIIVRTFLEEGYFLRSGADPRAGPPQRERPEVVVEQPRNGGWLLRFLTGTGGLSEAFWEQKMSAHNDAGGGPNQRMEDGDVWLVFESRADMRAKLPLLEHQLFLRASSCFVRNYSCLRFLLLNDSRTGLRQF